MLRTLLNHFSRRRRLEAARLREEESMRNALVLAMALLVLTTPTIGDSVNLRNSVRVPAGAEVLTLGDIATFDGPRAEALDDVVILDDVTFTKAKEIGVSVVRTALTDHGVHWGHIELNGGTIVIRPQRAARTDGPIRAMQAMSISTAETALPEAKHALDQHAVERMIGQGDIRSAIAEYLVTQFDVDAADLRLRFADRDQETLARLVDHLRVEFQLTSDLRSKRVGMTVRLWNQGRVEDELKFSFWPTVRRVGVEVTSDGIGLRQSVTGADVREVEQWVSLIEAEQLLAPEDIANRLAVRRLHKGDVIRKRDLKREMLIEKGDLVTVRCLVGGTVITMKAEAQSDGGLGDTIAFQRIGERATFDAEVRAAGDAVVEYRSLR